MQTPSCFPFVISGTAILPTAHTRCRQGYAITRHEADSTDTKHTSRKLKNENDLAVLPKITFHENPYS
jgi:hypothetical protein